MEDAEKIVGIFEDLSGSSYRPLSLMEEGAWVSVIVRTRTGNLLSRAALLELHALNDIIMAITTTASNDTITKVR